MEITRDDWKGIEYNFYDYPLSQSVLLHYPRLKIMFKDPLLDQVPAECIYRYIIAYYDMKSPLRVISDVVKRKKEASLAAGVKMQKNGKYQPEYEDVLLGANEFVNQMILDYVWNQQSTEFTLLAGFEQKLYVLTLGILKGEQGIKVTEIRELQQEINAIKDQLLAYDRSEGLRKELYKMTDKIRLELRPEDIAQKIADGLTPVDVKPYGDEYNFEHYGEKGSIPVIQ